MLTQSEPMAKMGAGPFQVMEKKAGSKEDHIIFQTDDLLDLRNYLMENGRKGMQITRYKGLGEMNAEQLLETTMDPANRVLLRVTADDEGVADDIFTTLMGDLVEPRKEFIEKHALEVQNLDV